MFILFSLSIYHTFDSQLLNRNIRLLSSVLLWKMWTESERNIHIFSLSRYLENWKKKTQKSVTNFQIRKPHQTSCIKQKDEHTSGKQCSPIHLFIRSYSWKGWQVSVQVLYIFDSSYLHSHCSHKTSLMNDGARFVSIGSQKNETKNKPTKWLMLLCVLSKSWDPCPDNHKHVYEEPGQLPHSSIFFFYEKSNF